MPSRPFDSSGTWVRGITWSSHDLSRQAQPGESKANGWCPRIDGGRTSRAGAKRRSGWLARPTRWNMDGAEQPSRNCSTGRTVVAAGTSPNHPWHRGGMGDGRPLTWSDDSVGRCETQDVTSSIETAASKERCERQYGGKPYGEKKPELRPVAAHYGLAVPGFRPVCLFGGGLLYTANTVWIGTEGVNNCNGLNSGPR
jgi:hypothetical protein